MKLLFLLVACLVISVAFGVETWANECGQVLHYECPTGQCIRSIESQTTCVDKDRQFRFQCSNFATANECSWSAYVNVYNESFAFNCGEQSVISGWISTYSGLYKDRITKFKCCKLRDVYLTNCRFSDVTNELGGLMKYQVPTGYWPYGVVSFRDNTAKDRQFQIEYCKARDKS